MHKIPRHGGHRSQQEKRTTLKSNVVVDREKSPLLGISRNGRRQPPSCSPERQRQTDLIIYTDPQNRNGYYISAWRGRTSQDLTAIEHVLLTKTASRSC